MRDSEVEKEMISNYLEFSGEKKPKTISTHKVLQNCTVYVVNGEFFYYINSKQEVVEKFYA